MINKKLVALFLSLSTMTALSSDLILIDKIETVIYGSEETSIIAKSDLERIGLDGQPRTKDNLIFEMLVYQDAKRYNIIDEDKKEEMIDKYLEEVQRDHGLTLEQLKEMFSSHGFTYEEGREQLEMLNTINQMLDFKVRSKVIIPEREVREYCEKNPVYQEEAYNLQRIFVPVDNEENNKEIKEKIEKQIALGQKITGANYTDPFWVEAPDLAEDKNFIKKMDLGKVSSPVSLEGGFELFELLESKERKLIPFEQRYVEVLNTLRKPLYEKLFDDYKKSLFEGSVIVHLS